MAITMQGDWTVSVKSKSASFPQRFIISGASSGNGTYVGATSTPPVFVTGQAWTIQIQNNPGGGFIDSDDQIKFPTIVANQYRFDIQSNDAGGDQDFNDLILTCSTPVTGNDFVVYGNVTVYSGVCIFNPCFPWYAVLDTPLALQRALANPALRKAIEALYPERVSPPLPPPPGPLPDPPPFIPLALPLTGATGMAPRQFVTVAGSTAEVDVAQAGASRSKRAAARAGAAEEVSTAAVSFRSFAQPAPSAATALFDQLAVARLKDRIALHCTTEALPGYLIRFQEYDRTSAELAGGAYTGTGNRETLGVTVTDRNGNYIFRFSRSLADFFAEAGVDTASGENVVTQAMPDLIAQLLDGSVGGGVGFETAVYSNVPFLKEINLCFPGHRRTNACQGGRVLQQIGAVRVGIPANVFDADGRITCTDTTLDAPSDARCAAWWGGVRFFGCFLDLKNKNGTAKVKWYTVRYRPKGSSAFGTFYGDQLKLFKISILDTAPVGPTTMPLEVVDGDPKVSAPAYLNVELDNDWAASDWFFKAAINTGAIVNGPTEFIIQGYDAAGNFVVGATDSIVLYLDNTVPDYVIDSVQMGSQTGGGCALFTLSGEPNPAPLTVRFKAIDGRGFLQSYGVAVRKGNISMVPITTTGVSASLGRSYPTAPGACFDLIGTRALPSEEPLADGLDFATSNVIPQSGNWLASNEPFCTFAVSLSVAKRVTNGFNSGVWGPVSTSYLLGIQQ